VNSLHRVEHNATIPLNEKDLTAMARSFKFGSIEFDGAIPNEDIISPFPNTLSTYLLPARG
jgi:hypothetical protein